MEQIAFIFACLGWVSSYLEATGIRTPAREALVPSGGLQRSTLPGEYPGDCLLLLLHTTQRRTPVRRKTMPKRDSTGTMTPCDPAVEPTFSSKCFWFTPASGPTSTLWPTEEVVVSWEWMSFLSKDSVPTGSEGCWVDCRVSGRYV